MRQFIYVNKSSGLRSAIMDEDQVLAAFSGYQGTNYDLFELTPRTIKTVTKQEII